MNRIINQFKKECNYMKPCLLKHPRDLIRDVSRKKGGSGGINIAFQKNQ